MLSTLMFEIVSLVGLEITSANRLDSKAHGPTCLYLPSSDIQVSPTMPGCFM